MNILWAFNFLPAKDPYTGKRRNIDLNDAEDVRLLHFLVIPTFRSQVDLIIQGLFLKLKPFNCEIVPRSAEKADLIRAQYAGVQSTFELFDRRVPTTIA